MKPKIKVVIDYGEGRTRTVFDDVLEGTVGAEQPIDPVTEEDYENRKLKKTFDAKTLTGTVNVSAIKAVPEPCSECGQ
jgi:hypothetical protein